MLSLEQTLIHKVWSKHYCFRYLVVDPWKHAGNRSQSMSLLPTKTHLHNVLGFLETKTNMAFCINDTEGVCVQIYIIKCLHNAQIVKVFIYI